ncbi:hypothetical protein HDEF_0143 [Candidatus Hamiltonella defensa 5AT (Acyrthosiphon pisum)]|uniref:Uncharacterized protein n=1 Tax=Hamiltonella defensa subsp. Acyrthosiphon pisum (strain 5AT) TaxID=572265 RepID=C4K8S9_HAMD5|nr:hypothetical protein HDEF_0143 [Candidatus Hamiltonella defensa 5AT (Acyrthosiphon pisum)]
MFENAGGVIWLQKLMLIKQNIMAFKNKKRLVP